MSFAAISGAAAPIWIAKDLGLFEKNGRDVTLLPTGDYNGMVVSLSKGLIDAGVISPPSTLKARKLGFREILDVGASGIEYSGTSVATTRTLVRESPDVARRVVKALVEA